MRAYFDFRGKVLKGKIFSYWVLSVNFGMVKKVMFLGFCYKYKLIFVFIKFIVFLKGF